MTYEQILEINFGKPSIDLLNDAIREYEGITYFYKDQLRKDKRPYWKGKIMNAVKTKNRLLERGKQVHGDNFKPEEMGLTTLEIQSIGRGYRG